jgi:hypothetical protein
LAGELLESNHSTEDQGPESDQIVDPHDKSFGDQVSHDQKSESDPSKTAHLGTYSPNANRTEGTSLENSAESGNDRPTETIGLKDQYQSISTRGATTKQFAATRPPGKNLGSLSVLRTTS